MGVMLWGYLWHRASWEVDLRTRDHVRLGARRHLWVQGRMNGLAGGGQVVL